MFTLLHLLISILSTSSNKISRHFHGKKGGGWRGYQSVCYKQTPILKPKQIILYLSIYRLLIDNKFAHFSYNLFTLEFNHGLDIIVCLPTIFFYFKGNHCTSFQLEKKYTVNIQSNLPMWSPL